MIQELLGGNNNNNPGFILGGGERKMFSFGNGGGILQATPTTVLPHHHHHQSTLVVSPSPPPPPSLSSSSSTPSSTAATAAANTTTTTTTNTSSSSNSNNNNPENNQVRCPRCDSANTKFCYYNNYNLTQPRHFCKTCRRYWTKGGALRNVPIGGGCRKNKSPLPPAPAAASKPKPATSASPATEIAGAHHSHLSPASPILWGSPQSSHLLALLRSANYPSPSQNPNPNPSPGLADNCMIGASLNVKEEGGSNLGRGLGLDPVGHVPSLGLCSSFWRSSSSSQQQNGFALGDHQQGGSGNGGVQELYQRLRSSPGSGFYGDQTAVVLTHHAGSSSVLESAPVNGGELGFWNNNNNNNTAFSWSDLQASTTTNGAYP